MVLVTIVVAMRAEIRAEPVDTRPSVILPDVEKTDWKALPDGYRALSNRYLIHPVDTGDWPLKLDSKHQLFVDDYLISQKHNVRRELHRPVKHPGNPLLKPQEPWEKETGGFVAMSVMRDHDSGKFRMWYCAIPLPDDVLIKQKAGPSLYLPTCYAESGDGVHWTKPNLGQFEIDGSRANNIVHWGNPMGLFFDPLEQDPARRFKGLFNDRPPNVPMGGIYLSTSPDGITWTQRGNWPVFIRKKDTQGRYYKGYFAPKQSLPAGYTDLNNAAIRYDPLLGKYVADVKFVLHGIRSSAMSVSDDLIHWSPPRMIMYPDALDPADAQFYFHHTFDYESMWLGFLRVMRTSRVGWKQTEIQLISSRDGITWTRAGNREEFLPLGGPESFDADYNSPVHNNKYLIVGDELWFYYMGSRYYKRDHAALPPTGEYSRAIGLARLRRDGFISLNGGDKPGTILTRPIAFSGSKLYVNAEVEPGGYVKAEVRDFYNKPLPQYQLARCSAVKNSTVGQRITWRGSKQLPEKTNTRIESHVRLLFELKNAKLYSFWIQ